MKITKEWLEERNACKEGIDWFATQTETDGIKILKKLIAEDKEDKLDWANWLIVRLMDYNGYVSYAIFAAEQVIDIFEKEYPKDKRPRLAIEAAKKCIDNPNAANAAYCAAKAADAAYYAAYCAANYAAYCAADAKKEMQLKILNYGLELLKRNK